MFIDVLRVGVLFADVLREIECDSALSCLNEMDLFCLHTTFLPRINSALDSFVESWNNHRVSTEQNRTPSQIFIEGVLRKNLASTLHSPTHSIGALPIPASQAAIAVPRSAFSPC